MTNFLHHEDVHRMPGRSFNEIEANAYAFLRVLQPSALVDPEPINCAKLIDTELQNIGIYVVPVKEEELPNQAASTDSRGEAGDPIEVLIREEHFAKIFAGGRMAHFGRATIAHELGHAALHVSYIRHRRAMGTEHMLMRTVKRGTIPAYEDAEWQAWAFGGSFLAPRITLNKLMGKSVAEIAAIYQVSTDMMEQHLRRLKWPGIGKSLYAQGYRRINTYTGGR